MYKQSIDNIKLVILPLDGTVLDLNRYRYNYVRHFLEDYKIKYTIETFYDSLSNMYDMYKHLPFKNELDIGPFNSRIERELYDYLSHKGVVVKEGCLELIEYLHQKDIKVAVISTHRQKDAIEYLKLCHIYNRIDYILGSDTISLPLPSTMMLNTIMNEYRVTSSETLVISSFMALNKAANKVEANVIYCEDLVAAKEEEIKSSYKTVHNLFDVMNSLLFDRFDEAEMYSPILGMTGQMSKDELDQVKTKLDKTYQDDPQLMNVIEQTYSYHVSKLQQQSIKDGSILVNSKKRFRFDDEDGEPLIPPIKKEEDKPTETKKFQPLNKDEESELTSLLNQINHKSEEKIISQEIEEPIEENIEEEKSSTMLNLLINFIYIVATSFLIVFISIIIYVALEPQFISESGLFGIIMSIVHIYLGIIENCFKFVLNGLHAFISLIPNYYTYVNNNSVFSSDGIILFDVFLFQIILMAIIKLVLNYILEEDE
ncbi:MAG: HAD family hydrolase [Erysipelotrichaceae bacterium]|nr:HAD family hydrolase [Erysipelotrichaceae bacterium]